MGSVVVVTVRRVGRDGQLAVVRACGRAGSRIAVAVCALLVAGVAVGVFPAGAGAEQASEPTSPEAGRLDAGRYHTCALLMAASVRCWGFGGDGQLGYANTSTIGDDETPGSVGPVSFGGGHTAKAIAAGDSHTCALLDDDTVRCWGFGGDGRLGYVNTSNVADPSSVGAVDLRRPVVAISAGAAHTCALLDDSTVRCWGYGGGGVFPGDGRLGYGNTDNIGDDETPGSVGPVKLGGSAMAVSAGGSHTCALLVGGSVRCWGVGGSGQLGYGSTSSVGDTASSTPDTVGPVKLGAGKMAVAISAGGRHTCALLSDGSVRCWGSGGAGQLGYANTNSIGDNETPEFVGSVSLGPGSIARAISAGEAHTCARLDGGSVYCWGLGASGRLGYGNQDNVGDNETPGSAGPVRLGAGRVVVAISAGRDHTCARLDHGSVRCWGYGASGRLGYCNERSIGDDETPESAGPVDLGEPGGDGAGCPGPPSAAGLSTAASVTGAAPSAGTIALVASDAARARALRDCLTGVAGHARRERRLAGHGSPRRRAVLRRHLRRHAASGRRRCLRLYGRTPGRITALRARALGRTQIGLSFNAPGTDGDRPPPARSYLIKQSLRPIRSAGGFARAQPLCKGPCRFKVSRVGGPVSLTVTDLHPHTTYYYAVMARDNVSARRGPRSQAVKVRTG